MEAAMQQTREKYEFRVRWLPYFLRPDIPPEGEPKTEIQKLESVDMYLKEAGDAVGIDLTNKCPIFPNTVKAHVLLQLVKEDRHLQNNLLEMIFKAHLSEGSPLDVPALLQIAESVGLRKADTESALASMEREDQVYEAINSSPIRDIRGIPCYFINRQRILQGAQEIDVYINIFKFVEEHFPFKDKTKERVM